MAYPNLVPSSKIVARVSCRFLAIVWLTGLAGLAFFGASTLAAKPSFSLLGQVSHRHNTKNIESNGDPVKRRSDVLLASLPRDGQIRGSDHRSAPNLGIGADDGSRPSATLKRQPPLSTAIDQSEKTRAAAEIDGVIVDHVPGFFNSAVATRFASLEGINSLATVDEPGKFDSARGSALANVQWLDLGAWPESNWLSSTGYSSELDIAMGVYRQFSIGRASVPAQHTSFDDFVFNGGKILSPSTLAVALRQGDATKSSEVNGRGSYSTPSETRPELALPAHVQKRIHLPKKKVRKLALNASLGHSLGTMKREIVRKKRKKRGPAVFGSIPLASSSSSLKSLVSSVTDGGTVWGRDEKKFSRSWRKVLSAARRLKVPQQLDLFNREVNKRILYRSDLAIYGRRDYWASPVQTIRRGRGDCEDFAVLKMWLLRKMGFRSDELHVIVVESSRLRKQHAVLSVRTKKGTFVLDSLSDRVKLESQIGHYRPIFSTNGTSIWLHGFPVEQRVASDRKARLARMSQLHNTALR